MEKSGITITSLKSIFSKFFYTQSDTIAVNEWSENHHQLNDPRVSFLEQRISSLNGGSNTLAVKSLRSARFKIIRNLAEAGDNVVTFNSWDLANTDKRLYERLNIKIRLSEDGNLDTFRSLIDENTKLIYLETISIKYINVPDFIKILSHASVLKIPVIVDNTASAGAYLLAPLKQRANLVIESLEDYLPENAKLKAFITDGNNFDWFGGKFKKLSKENLLFREVTTGKQIIDNSTRYFSFIDYLRNKINGHNGYPIPEDPFSLLRILEDIPGKIQKRSENALLLANYLKTSKHVLKVEYTGFTSGTGYFNALKYFKYGFGYYLSFTLNEDANIAQSFFEELKGHPAFKRRITYNLNKSEAYLAVPETDWEEIKEHFEDSFIRLAENIKHQYLIENPWIELVELA